MARCAGASSPPAIRDLELHFERRAGIPIDLGAEPVSYNTAPSMTVPVLYFADAGLAMSRMAWGFIPAWWKAGKPPAATINARLEDAAGKPMWRDAMRTGRALVPMLGYYEWQQRAGLGKQPHFIYGAREGDTAFAALWSSWRPAPDAEPQLTFAILTMAASSSVHEIHARMPVILRPYKWEPWLDPAMKDGRAVTDFAYENAERELASHAVSTYVNAPRNQGPRCIEALAAEPPAAGH